MYASILINTTAKKLNKVFDYIVPKEMEDILQVGDRVWVPFGKGENLSEGYVESFKEKSEFANKEIAKIEDSLISKENVELARLMADKYFCNVQDCIKLMLPPKQASKNLANRIKEKTARFVYLKLPKEVIEEDLEEGKIKSEKHQKLLKFLLENDGIDISELEAITDVSKAVMKTVEKNGFIEFRNEKVERNPLAHKTKKKDKKLVLTKEQQEAYDQIEFMIENEEYAEFLLHGVTGSRKNRGLFATN